MPDIRSKYLTKYFIIIINIIFVVKNSLHTQVLIFNFDFRNITNPTGLDDVHIVIHYFSVFFLLPLVSGFSFKYLCFKNKYMLLLIIICIITEYSMIFKKILLNIYQFCNIICLFFIFMEVLSFESLIQVTINSLKIKNIFKNVKF